ncbi:NUDIX hydrolase [Reinekea marinisedimentorum]|uniref:ADP-ribose pyrophosphatase YjhB (NUDIX family) n=1 Tax=Reinekea marinisedimentorum TaxID=230495 RepID=A0A4R3HWC5_9GAMM|nr:NUDIX hydrolase [Reinekea marinisedimentorum]TCS35679.1 ADP-ribose pyrophosphatase YjhB (NUDIX family) [Reinekea marinisedimentorum]
MLRFDVGDSRFNFRSAAVIIHEGHVLIHRSEKDNFWALPGGRVEFFETSEDTLPREILEELGVHSYVVRLLWHVENFFEYAGKNYHEISNYFLAELVERPEITPEVDFPGIEEELDLIYRWVPVNKLSEYVLKPSFLVEGIQSLPLTTEYIKFNELSH